MNERGDNGNRPVDAVPSASGAGPVKLGVCLCGGGLTGAFYETGVLRALDEYLGLGSVRSLFDVWVGTSAGSSVAGLICQGVSPERLYRALWDLDDPFFPLQRADVFRLDLRHWTRALGGAAWQAVKGVFSNKLRVPGFPYMDWGSEVERALPGGFFSLEQYRKTYAKALERNGLSSSFVDLPRELVITAMDLDTGERVVFAKGTELESTPIPTAVAASSAIAGFFEPVRVGGRCLIDGGTGRVAHIDLAFERGARSILVINPIVPVRLTKPHQTLMASAEPVGNIAARGFLKVWSQAFRIGTSERVRLGLEDFVHRHPDVRVFLIEPPLDDATMFLFSTMDERARHVILRHGYESAKRFLERNGQALKEMATPVRARWLAPVEGGTGAPEPPAGELHVLAGEEDWEGAVLAGTGW